MRPKDSEVTKHLLEFARHYKDDQTGTGDLARKILIEYNSLQRSKKKLQAAQREYKKLKEKGGEKDG